MNRRHFIGRTLAATSTAFWRGRPVDTSAAAAGLPAPKPDEDASWREGEVVLRNETLRVELFADRPVPRAYVHLPSQMRFGGATEDGLFVVNGRPVPWQEWEVRVDRSGLPGRIGYDLLSLADLFAIRCDYQLHGYAVSLEFAVVSDPRRAVERIEWQRLPLLTCEAPGLVVWREEWQQKGWNEEVGRGLWTPAIQERAIADLPPDGEPRPCLYCCAYQPAKVCATVLSNGRYLPLRNQVTRGGGTARFTVSPGPYQPRVRRRWVEPMRAQIAFLPDLNGDGRIDASDFQLWANRQLPLPWPTHRNAIWYKIYCGDPQGTTTTFSEAGEIIERVHRYTDGLPQVVYLVGWQYDGHDSGYPSLDRINERLGSRDELWQLHERAKTRLNTVLSYHINLDDSYPGHPGWDQSVIGRQPDGALMRWERFNDTMSYHITHTKDVESGRVFERLAAMMRTVPLEGAIHLDAFRDMNWSWEPDGLIGPVEELECGVKPILEFFKSRGIDVTIESMDSQGTEWAGLASGVLHVGLPRDLVQLRHGRMLSGGRGSPPSLWGWGLGSSINWDVIFREDGRDFDTSGAWTRLLDGIYLGTLLYHFYLERELTVCHVGPEEARLRFSDGVTTLVRRDNRRLLVTHGDVLIADDYDRFIPRGRSIYAYSRNGARRDWTLPGAFRHQLVSIRALDQADRPATVLRTGDRVALELKPRIPVKITLAS